MIFQQGERMNLSKKYLIYLLAAVAVILLPLGCSSSADTASSETAPVRIDASPVMNLEQMQNSFRDVVSSVLPAIVRIDVVEVRSVQSPGGDGSNPFFEFFFNPDGQEDGEREFRSEGLGSGVIVRNDGNTHYVLTNAHVIGDAEEITVRLDDGRNYRASLVGKDVRKDLALVEFTTRERDIVVAPLGDSDTLQVGDWVLAMGSPLGFQSTVTAGIVSALGRTGGPEGNISDFIQTDAAINRGNSGGALVNIYGEVVGINTWISSQTGGSIGLGFSIPINNVKKAIDDFIRDGVVQYGWLGVSIISIDEDMADSLGIDGTRGALVNSVYQTSPAGRSGILPGDFITTINGAALRSSDDLVREVGDLLAGETAQFTLIRNGREIDLPVEITSRESEDVIAGQSRDLFPGFAVYPLTEDIRSRLEDGDGLRGVIVSQVVPRTPAGTAGISPGDVLTRVNDIPVSSLEDFFAALNSDDRETRLDYVRDGVDLSVTIVK
jgi:serine protease Do